MKVHFSDFEKKKIFGISASIILELNTERFDHKCSCYLGILQYWPNAEDAASFLACINPGGAVKTIDILVKDAFSDTTAVKETHAIPTFQVNSQACLQ